MFCFGTLHALWFNFLSLQLKTTYVTSGHLAFVYPFLLIVFRLCFKWANVSAPCVKQRQFSRGGALVVVLLQPYTFLIIWEKLDKSGFICCCSSVYPRKNLIVQFNFPISGEPGQFYLVLTSQSEGVDCFRFFTCHILKPACLFQSGWILKKLLCLLIC